MACIRVILFADGPLRRRLEDAGVPVDVIALDEAVATADRHSASRLSPANVRRLALLLPFGMRLVRRLRQLRPDLIQTNTLKAALIGVPTAILAGRPLIWYLHDRISPDYLPGSMVWLIRTAARIFPRAVIANSMATANTLMPCPSIVVYPGFSPEQAASEPRRTVLEPAVVGMIGRISSTKGQLEFVRSIPRVLAEYPTTRFRIVGAPMFGAEDYLALVRTEAVQLGVDQVIDWVDFVADPREELDALSVFVHASPVPEPFGQVIVEAMVRGVPVVATRGGGATEIVEPPDSADGLTRPLGLLVEPGDPVALSRAIIAVLSDPSSARRRAERAWASALGRFAVGETAARIVAVWTARQVR
jgi:glycosyltransferase involved in cell wall biosynthesis